MKRTVSIVAAVSIIAVVAVFFAQRETEPEKLGKLYPEMEKRINDVASVSLRKKKNTVTLVRQEKNWTVQEKDGYPAKPGMVRRVLFSLMELDKVEKKTDKPEKFVKLGLEDAENEDVSSGKMTVFDKEGSIIADVIIGNQRANYKKPQVYVRKAGDNQCWLVAGVLDFTLKPEGWLDTRIVDVNPKNIKTVMITEPKGKTVTLQRQNKDDLYFALKELKKNESLKSDAVTILPAGALQELDFEEMDKAENIKFPKDKLFHAVYSTFDGDVVDVKLIEADEVNTIWAKFEFSKKETAEKEQPAKEENTDGKTDEEKKSGLDIAALNEKTKGRVYKIRGYKAFHMMTTKSSLVDKK